MTVLLALLLAACAAPEPLPDGELDYVFEKLPEAVRITLTIPARGRIKTLFTLEERWAAVDNTRDPVRNVRARGGDGRPLSAYRSQSHGWEVIHRRDEEISLSYELSPVDRELGNNPSEYYRVLLTDELFSMIGHVGLLRPGHLESGRFCRVKVAWKGFAEAGWKVVSSFSADQNGFEARVPLAHFIHSIFMAGKLRLAPRFVNGNVLQFAIHGDWDFSDGEFMNLTERVVQLERDFFNDHSQGYYLITLIPAGREESGNLGGTGLTDSFALFVNPGHDLRPGGESRLRVAELLAHEIFHNWNGGKILRQEPEELIYWFSEGFTDFYARRLLRRAGLMSEQQYAESLNKLFAGYVLSPVSRLPNEAIARDFWSRPEIKELPYRRGDIAALLTDYRIRQSSGGRLSLDDVMREVVRRSEEDGRRASTESLLELFAEYTPPDFAEELRAFIVEGRMPEIPSGLAQPHAVMTRRQLGRYQLGFDFRASRASRQVQGVIPNSRAHRAGLRDGQKLVGWSVRFGDVDFPVTIRIRDGQNQRRIKYLPQAVTTLPVPSFHPPSTSP